MRNRNCELKNNIPEIYCALSISLDDSTCINCFVENLRQLGISRFKIVTPKFEPTISIEIAVIQNEKCWYLDEILTKMFSQIDGCLIQLKSIIDNFDGHTCIDIAFYQYGTYPALEFIGENMGKIRFLEADISIDAY